MVKEHSAYHSTKTANWFDDIFLRKCFLKHLIERKIEVSKDEKEDVISCWMIYGRGPEI